MTLGGLALAVGILVDEATVEVENIHTQMEHDRLGRPGRAAGQRRDGGAAAAGDAVHPGGVHPVVLHAGGGPGAVRAAVAGGRLRDDRPLPALQHVRPGPVASGCSRTHRRDGHADRGGRSFDRLARRATAGPARRARPLRWLVVPAYLVAAAAWSSSASAGGSARRSSRRSTPGSSSSALQAPTGTRIEQTEADRPARPSTFISEEVGPGERRDLARLRRRRPVELPDQHRLPVDGRARRRRCSASP